MKLPILLKPVLFLVGALLAGIAILLFLHERAGNTSITIKGPDSSLVSPAGIASPVILIVTNSTKKSQKIVGMEQC